MIKKKDVGPPSKNKALYKLKLLHLPKRPRDEKDVQASEMMSTLQRHHMPEEAPAQALCWFLGARDLTGK